MAVLRASLLWEAVLAGDAVDILLVNDQLGTDVVFPFKVTCHSQSPKRISETVWHVNLSEKRGWSMAHV